MDGDGDGWIGKKRERERKVTAKLKKVGGSAWVRDYDRDET
jgi:hypothetical protein